LPGRLVKVSSDGSRRWLEASGLFLNHQLGLVDVRLTFEQGTTVRRWLTDKELGGVSPGLIPDAYVEFELEGLTYCAFVEYDRGTEALGRLERKTRAYLELAFSGRFERTFGRRFFRALFITDSPGRLSTMTKAVGRLTDRVVRLTTMNQLVSQGPIAPIWRSPRSAETHSLTDS